MSEPREVEAKFEIDSESIRVLSTVEAIGSFRVESRRSVSQHDRYFDSAQGDLARARASFRVRRKAESAEITFKGAREMAVTTTESHVASRLEDEVTVDADLADRIWDGVWAGDDLLLSPVRRAIEVCRTTKLVPTAELLNDRLVVRLVDDAKDELELAIDTCIGIRLTDGRRTEFNELELEAKGADRVALIAAAHALQELLPGIRPNNRTKLERVLQ